LTDSLQLFHKMAEVGTFPVDFTTAFTTKELLIIAGCFGLKLPFNECLRHRLDLPVAEKTAAEWLQAVFQLESRDHLPCL